jgi:hypothetical protein
MIARPPTRSWGRELAQLNNKKFSIAFPGTPRRNGSVEKLIV